MRVAVDTRWMQGVPRGMGRFAYQLLQPLIATGQVEGLAPGLRTQDPAGFPTTHGRLGFYPAWEQLQLPRLTRRVNADLLLCPYNTGPLHWPAGPRKLVVVVHDLIFLQDQQGAGDEAGSLYQRFGRRYRRTVVPRVARRAHAVVTVSEYSKREIVARLGVPEDRITVIPNGIHPDWLQAAAGAGAQQPAFLAVSGDAPSKNLSTLIAAFGQAAAALPPAQRLWVVGVPVASQPRFQALAQQAGVAERTEFFGRLSDDALRQLYRTAQALVLPSLHEGFGIPLIEAMASGLAIAASRASAVPEVVADAALLFDPADVQDMATALVRLAVDAALRDDLARRSIQRGQAYMPAAVAPRIAAFWSAMAATA